MAVNRKPGKREMLEKALGQESIPTEYPEHTSSIPRAYAGFDYQRFASSDLKPFTVRLRPQDHDRLRSYFEARGTSVSSGIRQVLLDFIESTRL